VTPTVLAIPTASLNTWGSSGEGFLVRGSATSLGLGPAPPLNRIPPPAMVVGSMRTQSQPINVFQFNPPALVTSNSRTASIQKNQVRRARHGFPLTTMPQAHERAVFNVTAVFIPWPVCDVHTVSDYFNFYLSRPLKTRRIT
jgi:hypothetical protein